MTIWVLQCRKEGNPHATIFVYENENEAFLEEERASKEYEYVSLESHTILRRLRDDEILKALALCANGCDDNGCIYNEIVADCGCVDCRRCVDFMAQDALLLIKEMRGASRPTYRDGKFYCGSCGKRIPKKIGAKFCHKCGKEIDWEVM